MRIRLFLIGIVVVATVSLSAGRLTAPPTLFSETWQANADSWPASSWTPREEPAGTACGARVSAGHGLLSCGDIAGKSVAERTTQHFGSLDLEAEVLGNATASTLEIRVFADHRTRLLMSINHNGWYQILEERCPAASSPSSACTSTVLNDDASPQYRPADAHGLQPYHVRLRLLKHGEGINIYSKLWYTRGCNDAASAIDRARCEVNQRDPEPDYWTDLVWHWQERAAPASDPTLYDTDGNISASPIEFRATNLRNNVWSIGRIDVTEPLIARPVPCGGGQPNHVSVPCDLGIAHDGSPVALELSRALKHVSEKYSHRNGNPPIVVDFEPHGLYDLDQPLILDGLQWLDLQGHGATFVRTAAPRAGYPRQILRGPYWVLNRCDHTTIGDFTVAGMESVVGLYDRDIEEEAGIRVSGGFQVTLHDLVIRNTGGDGIQGTDGIRGLTVRTIDVTNARRHGVSFNNGAGLLLEHGTIQWAGHSAVDLEPYGTDWIVGDAVIRDVRAKHIYNFFIAGEGDGQHGSITIEDSSVQGALGFAAIGSPGNPSSGPIVLLNNRLDFHDPEDTRWVTPSGMRNRRDLHLFTTNAVVVERNVMCFDSGLANKLDIHARAGLVTRNFFSGVAGGPDISASPSSEGVLIVTPGIGQLVSPPGPCPTTPPGAAILDHGLFRAR